ncbi:MAG: site-2 protease family protein [Opitutaceae bacterium]
MTSSLQSGSGSLRLFRVSGIQVYLHWSWLLVAWYQIVSRRGAYSSLAWNVAEYVGLFAIVLLHEFGHAFASRQVGGESQEILLWPFGGIAFVKVPPRPGAELWSIAAGPLVNVALFPVLLGLTWLSQRAGWSVRIPDFGRLLATLWVINKWVLIFNLLPIYPLDGGQMLRSLLWFGLGRARSLQVASIIGFVGIAALAAWAIWEQSLFRGLMALFLAQQCFAGFKHAQALLARAKVPRHSGFACPTCREAPPGGPIWRCEACGQGFDPFSTRAVCPHCATRQPATTCPNCTASHPLEAWATSPRHEGQAPVIDI